MKFDISQRLWLLNILPESGTLIDFRILRDLRTELAFSEQEVAEAGLKNTEQGVQWNPEKGVFAKEIEVGDRAKELCVAALKKLAKDGPVNPQNYTLFELFGVEGE